MSEWDELPETDLSSDPDARDHRYDACVRNGKKLQKIVNFAGRGGARTKLEREGPKHRADAGLRKF